MDVQLAKEVMISSKKFQEISKLPGFRNELGMDDNEKEKRGGPKVELRFWPRQVPAHPPHCADQYRN